MTGLHNPMGTLRRIIPPILRTTVVAALLVGSVRSTCAQAPSQLPHAWSEAVYALAQKSAVAMGQTRSFSLDVRDVSQAAPVELAEVRRTFDDDITARGMKPAAPPVDTEIQLSISHTLAGFTLVAEIHRGEAQQLAIVAVASEEPPAPQPGTQTRLQTKVIWQQLAPLLDFDQIAADPDHAFWYFLEPERLIVYEFDRGQQVLHDAQPIPRRYATRDLRGWIEASDATHVSAFVGAGRCDAAWNPSLTMECRENSGQQWPMGPASWTFTPGRNYFSGTITLASSLQAKFPPFYSSASPLAATSGQGPSRRVIAGVDGQAQFFEGSADAASIFEGWGSDVASIASACGSGWQVVATGSGDWTQKDQIQLYEIRDQKAVAIGEPIEFPGPTLALWTTDDGKSARVISRNLESGLYEASIVSVACGN
ncbi:MAG: hypothetical protein WCC21_16340 [Candidatus Acidiferrales bacterium]